MLRRIFPYIFYSVLSILCVLLQSQLFIHLEIFHAVPDLVLLVVVFAGLRSDWRSGIILGIVMGFWPDLLNSAYFGLDMIVYAVIGGCCGTLGSKFPSRGYESNFFLAVAASIVCGILTLTVFNLVGADISFWQSFGGTVLPMTFYNALLVFICLPLFWLFHKSQSHRGVIDFHMHEGNTRRPKSSSKTKGRWSLPHVEIKFPNWKNNGNRRQRQKTRQRRKNTSYKRRVRSSR